MFAIKGNGNIPHQQGRCKLKKKPLGHEINRISPPELQFRGRPVISSSHWIPLRTLEEKVGVQRRVRGWILHTKPTYISIRTFFRFNRIRPPHTTLGLRRMPLNVGRSGMYVVYCTLTPSFLCMYSGLLTALAGAVCVDVASSTCLVKFVVVLYGHALDASLLSFVGCEEKQKGHAMTSQPAPSEERRQSPESIELPRYPIPSFAQVWITGCIVHTPRPPPFAQISLPGVLHLRAHPTCHALTTVVRVTLVVTPTQRYQRAIDGSPPL